MKGVKLLKKVIILSLLSILVIVLAFELNTKSGMAAEISKANINIYKNGGGWFIISGSTDAGKIYVDEGQVNVAYVGGDDNSYTFSYNTSESTYKYASIVTDSNATESWAYLKIDASSISTGSYKIRLDYTKGSTGEDDHIDISFEIAKHDMNINPSIEDVQLFHIPELNVGSSVPEGATVTWFHTTYGDVTTNPEKLRNLGVGTHEVNLTVTHPDYNDYNETIYYIVTKGESEIVLGSEKYKLGEEITATVYIEDYDIGTGEIEMRELPASPIYYTLEYKAESGSVSSGSLPTSAGKYQVRAVLNSDLDSQYYTPEASFEIIASKGTGSVIAKDINYSEKLNITVESKDYDVKKAILYYKLQSEDDSKYTKEEPEDPGKYTVKAVFPANDKFEAAEAKDNFEIKPVEGKAKITVADIKYGETPKPVIETEDYDKDKAKIYYKVSGANDSTFKAIIPKNPGSYIAQAVFPANKGFSQHIETCKFQIIKADGEGKVTAKDVYVGMKSSAVASSNKNGTDKVKYEYKLVSESDSAYSAAFPSQPGTYKVRATFPETDLYLAAKAETTFKMSYMPSPGYSKTGVKGKNDFYTSDVTIKAPAGYQISTSLGSGYVDSLKYSTASQSKYMYFKEISTGALSDKVEMPKYKIDSTKPEFSGNIKNNDVLFVDEKVIDINDANLESVTVNGKSVPVSNGRASVNFAANGGMETYTVVAIDKAGNEISYTITVKSEWMEKGVIPAGEKIKLYAGTGYELEAGKWQVSGDTTVYNGGMKVYVADDTELSFSK